MIRDLRKAAPFVLAMLGSTATLFVAGCLAIDPFVQEDFAVAMLALLFAYGVEMTVLACLAMQRMDTRHKNKRQVTRHG